MENTTLSKNSVAFGWSLALSSVANALLVVAKEKSPAVQKALQSVTGHHWTAHAAIVVLLFLGGGWLFGRANHGQGFATQSRRLIPTVVAATAGACAVIVGFYLIAD